MACDRFVPDNTHPNRFCLCGWWLYEHALVVREAYQSSRAVIEGPRA